MAEVKELKTTREFNAPREKVWSMWTDPQHLSQWWAPDYFTVPVCELDVKVGGKLRIDMQGPDGVVYPSTGEYVEVKEPERLVLVASPLDAAGKELFTVQHAVDFGEDGGKTRLDIVSTVLSATPEAEPYLAGMEEGLGQALGKLEKLV
jgi:uncharacterized protein YndB with AHSA1/START domain